jgi:CMP-N-acetylneuraminic acid synthetase
MNQSDKLIYALVPARSGSKGIKDKNIIPVLGKPMMAHSILQGLESEYINEVFVSTDSEKYAEIAREYGAHVPFMRPAEISGDMSTDFEVFDHFVSFLDENGETIPDILVQLRPTYPTRTVADLDRAIKLFLTHFEEADSLRSVIEAPETPYKMWRNKGTYLTPLLEVPGIDEPYNAPRQSLPKVYWQNACIDIVKTECILKKRSMTGDKILMFEMDKQETLDIDIIEDLKKIEEKKSC